MLEECQALGQCYVQNKDLSKEIEAAFGEKGLGIILVKGYPDF